MGKQIRLTQTHGSKLPAIWEKGGGATNTGKARIVADKDGKPKKPVYIRRKGELSNGDHALFVVEKGDVVCDLVHSHGDFDISLYQITDITDKGDGFLADCEDIAIFKKEEWSPALPEKYLEMVHSGMAKSNEYHCRTPHYVKEDE
jgi:hypothetical protein